MILKGNILITTDKNIILETLRSRPDIKIISLDEENELRLDPRIVIPGTILLPPVEAKIAEVDGNEDLYNMIYSKYLVSEPVKEYMSSILAYLYMGGKILLYFPDNDYNNTIKKLLFFILVSYGIHIGIIGDKNPENTMCYFDAQLEPTQLLYIYFYTNVMSWQEFLYYYPDNFMIPDYVMNVLFNQIKPYGDNLQQKLEVINRLRVGIKKNQRLINPIQSKGV